MSRRHLRVAAAVAAAATTAAIVSGCGGGDSAEAPTSSQAKAALVKADAAMQEALTRPGLGRATSSWKPAVKAVRDPTCDTGGDGGDRFRWRSSAALSITDRGTDGDGIVAAVIGSLGDTFDGATYVGDLDDDPALVLPVTYGSGADAVSVDITIERAAQGWTFLVAGRTVCLKPA